jgi:hypothetical protein
MQSNINNRFKDAPWYIESAKESILMVGMGGINSNALYCLSKTIPCKYYLVDADITEEYNIGCQFFTGNQIGKPKIEAIIETMKSQSLASFIPLKKMYSNEYLPITITGLDNMKARKEVFGEWKKHEDRELLICARLRANLYEIYVVTPDKEEEYEKTLFDDSEVDEGPCTFKQTAYFGMLIGARITHVLVNYLTNKYMKEDICNIPFCIKEVGEPFIFEII